MRHFLSWLAGLIGHRSGPPVPPNEADLPACNNTRFALELYLQLKDSVGPYENVVCSPFGISMALAMVHAGARGRTAAQFARALHGLPNDSQWPAALAALRERLLAGAKRGDCIVRLATGLWAPADRPLQKAFSNEAERMFDAAVRETDFSQVETACGHINQWIVEATLHLAQAVVARSEITPAARLVLINTVGFQGFWDSPFDAQRTLGEPFWVTPDAKISVSMMWQRGYFAYHQFPFHFADRVQVLELPYAGKALSMVLLYPEGTDGIVELEHTLSRQKGKLDSWLGGLRSQEIDVALPKFTVGSRFNAGEDFSEMGLADAFSDSDADFTGMRPERDLHLSHVFHQAFVAVDEQGPGGAPPHTGAAGRATPEAPSRRIVPVFRADHPFLFLIHERASGQVLFMGRVMRPPVSDKAAGVP
jgi:serpin B